MKTIFKFLTVMALIFAISSCSEDAEPDTKQGDEQTKTEDNLYKTEGYVLASITQSGATNSYYAGYSKDLPSGEIDLTQFNAYAGYYPKTTYKNFIFGGPLNSTEYEIGKYAIDNKTGKIVYAGKIITDKYIANVKILSDNVGVYTLRDDQTLYVFNPETMQLTSSIELPNAKTFENADKSQLNSYYSIIYRKQDNKIFLPLLTNDQKTGPFYDAEGVYLEVIDMNTKTWVKTASYANATYATTRGAEHSVVDEQGNIYITCQGQYSLDGKAGPTAPQSSRPQILKIPAGSNDFDSDYSFNPVDYLGYNSLVAQFVTGTVYGKNGTAYAAISAKPDDPRILELLGKLGAGTITEAEYQELRNLVINGPNCRWAKLDLNAKTATVINDIPFTAGFSFPFGYSYDGKMYFQVYNKDQNLNGFYEYDATTNKAKSIYNITAGGVATQFVKLTK